MPRASPRRGNAKITTKILEISCYDARRKSNPECSNIVDVYVTRLTKPNRKPDGLIPATLSSKLSGFLHSVSS